MKIKRSSWHYKISKLGGFEKSNDNLCRYFWRLVFKVVVVLVAIDYICFILHAWLTSGMAIVIAIGVIFVIVCLVLPPLAIHFLRKKLGKSPETPYGNIVSAYVSAKKRKVCPLIEYV